MVAEIIEAGITVEMAAITVTVTVGIKEEKAALQALRLVRDTRIVRMKVKADIIAAARAEALTVAARVVVLTAVARAVVLTAAVKAAVLAVETDLMVLAQDLAVAVQDLAEVRLVQLFHQ